MLESLDDFIDRIRNLGERLIPFNYPKSPIQPVDDLLIFKSESIIVDGYSMIIHYQKSDYDDYLMEVLQIYGETVPFLPFTVVTKLAKKFLGSHELSLVEMFKEGRKIYCWTIYVDRTGRPISPPYELEAEICEFDDLKYNLMQSYQMFFF